MLYKRKSAVELWQIYSFLIWVIQQLHGVYLKPDLSGFRSWHHHFWLLKSNMCCTLSIVLLPCFTKDYLRLRDKKVKREDFYTSTYSLKDKLSKGKYNILFATVFCCCCLDIFKSISNIKISRRYLENVFINYLWKTFIIIILPKIHLVLVLSENYPGPSGPLIAL